MSENLNDITEEEIEEQGRIERHIFCDECDYDAGCMSFKDGVFKVNMQGGYFAYDGDGGAETKCPICGLDSLNTLD